ncbi:MAG TPA: type II toxin-antitoxin system RelE/ParE family toxin [Acidobacteriota bacterium]|nr:type II toxin-antitoxin system RelE/ParE family toxin [Acidobacteriota bacterium]
MTRTLEFLDEALQEAEDAARWYAERSTVAAIGFAEELDVAAAQIENSPTTWPIHEHNTRRFLLRRFPYSVVYRVDATRVVIVAVAHAHRRPGYWRDRLEDPG